MLFEKMCFHSDIPSATLWIYYSDLRGHLQFMFTIFTDFQLPPTYIYIYVKQNLHLGNNSKKAETYFIFIF